MKRFCPHCGGTQFKAVVKKPGAIQINEDGAVILKEMDKFAYEVAECLKCKGKINGNDELVETLGKPCTQCNTIEAEENLIDGLCPVCDAMKNRADLANATPQELIKRLLEFEKAKGAVQATKIEAKIEVADKTVEAIDTKAEEEAKKKSEAAKKAAATRKANAEKKALEDAKKAEEVQEPTPAPITIPEPIAPVDNVAPEFGLPDVDDNGMIVPPGMDGENDPF